MAETTSDHSITATIEAQDTTQRAADSSPQTSAKFMTHTLDFHDTEEDYKAFAGMEDKPTRGEILGWYLYELCSYFIHTVLLPIVFPLIISQAVTDPKSLLTATAASVADAAALVTSDSGYPCKHRQMQLYQSLTNQTIGVSSLSFSPFEWTSISWLLSLILAMPVLAGVSRHLDRSPHHQLITLASISLGALFCLPVGFFKTTWLFPPYISVIVAASIVASSGHTRDLNLMLRGFTAPTIPQDLFQTRTTISGWLSLHSTAAGSLGAALIAAFTYHMLENSEKFISLWIVCIFSGLLWAAGVAHIFLAAARRHSTTATFAAPTLTTHITNIFLHPHAAINLASAGVSSFSSSSVFTAAVLHLVGQICLKPLHILFLWLTYFLFPLLALPLAHPLQHLLKADAAKMQILGLLLTSFTSAFGFLHRKSNWAHHHVLLLAAVQSTASGLLHAFGRSLTLDCAPKGKEGVHSMWYTWVKAVGTCAGFWVSSAAPGNVGRPFGMSFWGSVVAAVVLIFGNVSGLGGGLSAGNVGASEKDVEHGGLSPVRGVDDGGETP